MVSVFGNGLRKQGLCKDYEYNYVDNLCGLDTDFRGSTKDQGVGDFLVTDACYHNSNPIEALSDVFLMFDIDGSGEIEGTELHRLGTARRITGQKKSAWTVRKNEAKIWRMILFLSLSLTSTLFRL